MHATALGTTAAGLADAGGPGAAPGGSALLGVVSLVLGAVLAAWCATAARRARRCVSTTGVVTDLAEEPDDDGTVLLRPTVLYTTRDGTCLQAPLAGTVHARHVPGTGATVVVHHDPSLPLHVEAVRWALPVLLAGLSATATVTGWCLLGAGGT